MNEVAARQDINALTVDDVIARGDLSKLNAEQRVSHYNNVCRSVGLNPLTQPFMYITLNGKLQLYARKDATDQLRKLNGISVSIGSYAIHEGLLTVHVRATDKTGRSDEDYGVVSVVGLKGEAASNAFMKAVTKAKRRVTLSVAGLGFLDESELDDEVPQFANVSRDEQPLRLSPTMSQAQRTELVSQVGNQADEAATGPRSADNDGTPAERVPGAASVVERAHTQPYAIARNGDSATSWRTWWETLMAYVRAAPDAGLINEWTTANAQQLAALAALDPAKHAKLIAMINHEVAARDESSG